ncbi:MAG: ATP-binding protein [Gracilibacteraceae bacterium]|jgi:predicted AAA+ superfamily ATPase|nr:ATP-binding protein [Gracilibacteraceae bacterium]
MDNEESDGNVDLGLFEKKLHRLRLALPRLCVFPGFERDEVVGAFLELLETVGDDAGAVRFYQGYFAFVRVLRGRGWPEYLVGCVMRSRPELYGMSWEELGLSDLLKRDLRALQEAADLEPDKVKDWAAHRWPELGDEQGVFTGFLSWREWPCWRMELGRPGERGMSCEDRLLGQSVFYGQRALFGQDVGGSGEAMEWLCRRQQEFVAVFAAERDWADNGSRLCEHWRRLGTGVFQVATAFCWEPGRGLIPVERPDPVALNNLFRQEREQRVIRENTETFLRGYPASDVLVYGSRGTGKSSLVKALLNAYAERGLRLIQLRKKHLAALPEIAGEVVGAPLKFVVFIDDLSFDEKESDYKELKSLLEGGLASRPPNMLVYATSNRRHLMPETFAERGGEVHAQDAVEEKLSLADRFGITVTFLSPDQESYLAIVRGLAEQAGLLGRDGMTEEMLMEQALRWAALHNGRSGRSARQFVQQFGGGR